MCRNIFIWVITALFTPFSYAQCDVFSLKEASIGKIENGYSYIKTFPVTEDKLDKNVVEYSFVLSKNTKYMLHTFHDANEGYVSIELYDANRTLIGKDKKGVMAYSCNSTGVHYMKFTHHGKENKCSIAILSFKR